VNLICIVPYGHGFPFTKEGSVDCWSDLEFPDTNARPGFDFVEAGAAAAVPCEHDETCCGEERILDLFSSKCPWHGRRVAFEASMAV